MENVNSANRPNRPMLDHIHVRHRPGGLPHQGLLSAAGRTIHCCLGRSGIHPFKREGDGVTPSGSYNLLFGFFRESGVGLLPSMLPMSRINRESGWCDDPANANYNRFVKLPFSASHEKMMRDDRLYDICIVMDHNILPRKRNAGSAIFFHQTRENRGPTEGCVAIDPDEMRRLLPVLSTFTTMHIHP